MCAEPPPEKLASSARATKPAVDSDELSSTGCSSRSIIGRKPMPLGAGRMPALLPQPREFLPRIAARDPQNRRSRQYPDFPYTSSVPKSLREPTYEQDE